MAGCCSDAGCSSEPRSVDEQVKKVSDPGCCDGGKCCCDGEHVRVVRGLHSYMRLLDTCIDKLAQVVCADDDSHIHVQEGRGDNNGESATRA